MLQREVAQVEARSVDDLQRFAQAALRRDRPIGATVGLGEADERHGSCALHAWRRSLHALAKMGDRLFVPAEQPLGVADVAEESRPIGGVDGARQLAERGGQCGLHGSALDGDLAESLVQDCELGEVRKRQRANAAPLRLGSPAAPARPTQLTPPK